MSTKDNPLIVRALAAHNDSKREAADRRARERQDWIDRAVKGTLEAASQILGVEPNPDDFELELVRRNLSVQITFYVCGDSDALCFRTFTEENAPDYKKNELFLVNDDASLRIQNLADLGCELEKLGYRHDEDENPTAAPERSDSGA